LEECIITDVSALPQVAGPVQQLVSEVGGGVGFDNYEPPNTLHSLTLWISNYVTLQNTLHVSGNPFLCLFFGNDFSGCFFSITLHVG
jgi:hypothetical protein